jgi:DNA-directed RNA polymerase specialized sigma24 family protein
VEDIEGLRRRLVKRARHYGIKGWYDAEDVAQDILLKVLLGGLGLDHHPGYWEVAVRRTVATHKRKKQDAIFRQLPEGVYEENGYLRVEEIYDAKRDLASLTQRVGDSKIRALLESVEGVGSKHRVRLHRFRKKWNQL